MIEWTPEERRKRRLRRLVDWIRDAEAACYASDADPVAILKKLSQCFEDRGFRSAREVAPEVMASIFNGAEMHRLKGTPEDPFPEDDWDD